VPGHFDPERMAQVVQSLLFNALKFGQGQPVEISLRCEESGALLTVVDHGIGIRPEDRTRIFERFERAVSARHYGELGLGLWMTRQMLEAHQGAIRVEDTPGGGATFEILLPLREQVAHSPSQ